MDFKKFNETIETINNFWDYLDKLSKLNIEIFNTPICKCFSQLEKMLWDEVYDEYGSDWIYWYIYEKMGSSHPEELKAYDENDNEICKDVEGLYNLIEEYKKHNNNEEE